MSCAPISNRLRALRSSIAVRCLACLIVYALLIAALLYGVSAMGDRIFENAFPSMETVLMFEDDLENDRFDALQSSALENCQIVIYDDLGTALYASSVSVAQKIPANDLDLISEYGDQGVYEVYQEKADDGSIRYRIIRCTYVYERGISKWVDAWCVLDEDRNILNGTLFSNRTALTQREFDFIQGTYSAQMTVERYDYLTEDGQGRTLVLVAPLVSEARYQQVVDEVSRLLLYAMPVAVLITIATAWYLVHQIKHAISPLDSAIEASRNDEVVPVEAAGVPMELQGVYRNFTVLMDELRASRNDRQRVIADLSHDLKTPLTVIYGYASAFNDGRVPPEKRKEYLKAIADKALAANELIDTLFAYAKMEHPDFEAHLEPVDVAAATRAVAAEAVAQVEQAGCSLELNILPAKLLDTGQGRAPEDGFPPMGPFWAFIDVQLFQRLLANLIGNACAHNPAGTRICLTCEADLAARAVRVRVADTGTGIAPQVAANAFKPFVTSNVARTANGGTGLGLTIALRCAELMHGKLRVTERPAAPWATEFVLELPHADAAPNTAE